MKSTLSERLKEAMAGPPKISGVALAEACGVAPPSVSGWRTGGSKSLEGSNLLAAAKFLGVRPEWLADGIGPMRPSSATPTEVLTIKEPGPETPWTWPFRTIKPAQWSLLDDEQKQDVEKYVLLQVKSREPPKKRNTPAQIAGAVRSA